MKSYRMLKDRQSQRGVIVVAAVGGMVLSVAFIALAIDVGRMVVVKNELQNAADAAALAGAAKLQSYTSPKWDAACSAAISTISKNKTDGKSFVAANGVVKAGKWNVTNPGSSVVTTSNCTTGVGPQLTIPFTGDVPAISVTLTRNDSVNGGPGPLLSAVGSFLGFNNFQISATSVAGVTLPSSFSGGVAPIVLNKCVVDKMKASGGPAFIYDDQDTANNGGCERMVFSDLNNSNQPNPSSVINVLKKVALGKTDADTEFDYVDFENDPLRTTNGQMNSIYDETGLIGKKVLVMYAPDASSSEPSDFYFGKGNKKVHHALPGNAALIFRKK